MKIIKGPPDYTGPPSSPEPEKIDKKAVTGSPLDQSTGAKEAEQVGPKQVPADNFESSLTEIAKTLGSGGLQNQSAVSKVVDTVLEEILGKDFLSTPDAASLREAITPFISQDEQMMNKLNSILNRLGKS
jgi:hypothetical protein